MTVAQLASQSLALATFLFSCVCVKWVGLDGKQASLQASSSAPLAEPVPAVGCDGAIFSYSRRVGVVLQW